MNDVEIKAIQSIYKIFEQKEMDEDAIERVLSYFMERYCWSHGYSRREAIRKIDWMITSFWNQYYEKNGKKCREDEADKI